MRINIEGRVSKLAYMGDTTRLSIETGVETKFVDLPIRARNQFELIPYQVALLGQRVEYYRDQWRDKADNAVLIILSGTLEGQRYDHTFPSKNT